jgi:hypothetical protein
MAASCHTQSNECDFEFRFFPSLCNTLFLKKRLVVVIGLLILRIKNDPKVWSASPSTENEVSSTEYSPSVLF